MAIKDPGLISDTCIFHEATAGDGGNHTNPTFWLSPDATIVGAPMGNVLGGTTNTVNVIPRRKTGGCDLPPGTTINPDGSAVVLVELYVCKPLMVIDPTQTSQATLLGTKSADLLSGASSTVPFTFVTTNNTADPQGPGHKCLIARSYPDALTPDQTDLRRLPEDQHYAQRNICIQICGGPGAANVPGPCQFEVSTANPDTNRPEDAIFVLEADTDPSQAVRSVLLPLLRQVPAFKRLAGSPPRTFDLHLPDFPGAGGRLDRGHEGCLGLLFGGKLFGGKSKPTYKVDVQLKPKQLTFFNIRVDLSGSSFGDAHIFHLTQARPGGEVQGGVTVVFVVG